MPQLGRAIVVEDSSYVVLSGGLSSVSSSNPMNIAIFLVRFDLNGNVVNSLEIADTIYSAGYGNANADALIGSSFGDLFVTGRIVDYTNSPDNTAFLARVSVDLSDTVWRKEFQYIDRITGGLYCLELSNGDIMVSGYSVNANYRPEGLLAVFDTTGELKWMKGYLPDSGMVSSGFNNTEEDELGNIYVSSTQSWDWSDVNSNEAWVFKLDSIGNEIWRRRLGPYDPPHWWPTPSHQFDEYFDSSPVIYLNTSNELICAWNRAYEYATSGWVSIRKTKVHVAKLSLNGDSVWEKFHGDICDCYPVGPQWPGQYNAYQHMIPNSIIELPSGEYVIGGRSFGESEILKVGPQGDSIYMRKILTRENNFPNWGYYYLWEKELLYDLDTLPNGRFIGAGEYISSPGGSTHPNGAQLTWVVQLDEYGCDSIGCQYLSVEEEFFIEDDEAPIKLYPNPTSSTLNVEFYLHLVEGSVELYSMMGQFIKSYDIESSKIEIDVSDLVSGSYIFIIKEKGRVVGREIVVKE